MFRIQRERKAVEDDKAKLMSAQGGVIDKDAESKTKTLKVVTQVVACALVADLAILMLTIVGEL